ncbi:Dps family protein [Actinoalloteichus hymeniacidonis]|uniref:DNA-binding ferritin-like protein (Oxidative damage protectant) n=1 Tax=Actinoalloteichus hymeniacidonis TaxID=340345 RepID=A0AAC9HKZ2_9PSEU|nr:DNA starvation/stationary phase protection protein [Actinoalloteichus hymeniacidonis]AOS61076.1 DNA-binding ferritin-like protein (oxidative damage protectant) [Actinoalloteichus hymeniacidonis]MBB5910924.1 starvation-inducible DNA-binding protein [Actinoalloteichus hymeniacidonis]
MTKNSIRSPLTSPLGDGERDVTCHALQATLLEMIDLHLFAKQEHWNVVGPNFRSAHLQLDELVSTTRDFADDVAERMSALAVSPDGRSATVAQGSGLHHPHAGWRTVEQVVDDVVAALSEVVHRLRARIDETDKTDQVTQDLLIQITASLEKARWMWQAQQQKK